MKNGFWLFLYLSCFCLILPGVPQAQESLVFDHEYGPLISGKISRWLKNNNLEKETYDISLAHLNNDRVPEILLRLTRDDHTCPEFSGCRIYVFGDTEKELLSIGKFRALRVSLGKDRTNGIRDLIACVNPWNDFDCIPYKWSTKDSFYVRQENF